MIKYRVVFMFLITLVASCSKNNEYTSTYNVTNKTFEHSLTIDGFVEPVKSTSISTPRNIGGTIGFIIEDGVFVKKGDTVCIIESPDLQTFYDQQLLQLENARAEVEKMKVNLKLKYTLLEAQIQNNEADTKIARLDSSGLEFTSANQKKIKELELKKATITKNKYGKKLKALEGIQQTEIRTMQMQIQRSENVVNATKDRVNTLIVTAPTDGLVIRAVSRMTGNKLQVGDRVWSNMQLVIMPELSKMKIKIEVPEQEFKSININDSVSYTFDAMPLNIGWGKIKAKVPVGKEYKQGSKVKYFEIEASLDSVVTMPDPGFTVNCKIMLKEEKSSVVIPQITVFSEDTIKVVYVKMDKGYEKRQVLTGISSPKETVITQGLQENEIIALIKPKNSDIKKTRLLSDSIENSH